MGVEGEKDGARHLAAVIRLWHIVLHERVASVPLVRAMRKAHGEFRRSSRCEHAKTQTCIRAPDTHSLPFYRLFEPRLSLSLEHTHTHTHARTHARHGRERTGRSSRHFYATAAVRRVRRTAADRGPSSPRDDDRLNTRNTRTPPRAGLPRLFKFALTVRSARRRTPAVAHAASNVARDTSALLVREPTIRSHTLGVYFSRDATSPIRTSYQRRRNCQDGRRGHVTRDVL